jgi:hypothetical protein
MINVLSAKTCSANRHLTHCLHCSSLVYLGLTTLSGAQAGGVQLTSEAVLADENFWTMKIMTVAVSIPEREGGHVNQISRDSDDASEWHQ